LKNIHLLINLTGTTCPDFSGSNLLAMELLLTKSLLREQNHLLEIKLPHVAMTPQ